MKIKLLLVLGLASGPYSMMYSSSLAYLNGENYNGYISPLGGVTLTNNSPTVLQQLKAQSSLTPWQINLRMGNTGLGTSSFNLNSNPEVNLGSYFTSILVNTDGSFALGGAVSTNNGVRAGGGAWLGQLMIIRMTPLGFLDTSYEFFYDVNAALGYAVNADQVLSSITPDGSGGYYGGGYATSAGPVYHAVIVHALSNATLDTAFGTNGIYMPTGYTKIMGVANQDDNIVYMGLNGGLTKVGRALPTGAVDPDFTIVAAIAGTSAAGGLVLDSENRIITISGGDDGLGNPCMTVARYNVDGGLDATFNGVGYLRILNSSAGKAVAVCADDSIVAVGADTSGNTEMKIVKITESGVVDTNFGTNGVVMVQPEAGFNSVATAVAITPSNKIAVTGSSKSGVVGATVLLNANGSLDTSFFSLGYTQQPANGLGSGIVWISMGTNTGLAVSRSTQTQGSASVAYFVAPL